MSLWSSIIQALKGIMKKMIGGRTIEQTLHVSPIMSSQMEHAIELWSSMYKGQAPWVKEPTFEDPVRIVSLGLPSLIASEKARTALLEMSSEITTPTKEVEKENPNYKEPEPDEFGNIIPSLEPKTIIEDKPVSDTTRAEFLNDQYQNKLLKQLRKQIEYGIAKGGLVIKPYPVENKVTKTDKDKKAGKIDWQFEFDFTQADSFYPLAFNASGQITQAAFLQTQVEKDVIYRRLEYHKWQNNTVTIVNKAFKSSNNQTQVEGGGVDLGHEVPLSSVDAWKDLRETVTITNVQKPLFAYFKMPEANTVDTSSPLGVSGYSRAVDLIKDADMQYSRLLWEYEAGEMAIDIDRDALKLEQDSKKQEHTVPNRMQARLFRKVDLGESDTYVPFAPALRDTSFIQGLNTILMRIEDVTGLSRGTLSDAASEARTATELKILKQRSYQTNADIQQAIEDALKDVIYIMNAYCDLYKITKEGKYDVSFEWDDSIITDVDTELGKQMTLLNAGLTSKKEVRMWYFGETERQAEQALLAIEKETMQAAENEMVLNANNDDDNDFFKKAKEEKKNET